MSRKEIPDELRRALQGVLNMAYDRGYEPLRDDPLLKPPPSSCAAFFRSFPTHFDVISQVYGEKIRFEFWNLPLDKLPGQAGQLAMRRVCRAARAMSVAVSAVRLVLVVPHYSQQQEKRERKAIEHLGAELEVFPYHFFSMVHNLRRQQSHQLLKDRLLLERLRELYGPVANLPKISADDLLCRYLGAGPGDMLLSGDSHVGMVSWRLVVPCRRPGHDNPEELKRRVLQRRSDRAKFLGYLKTISEDPNYS